MQAQSLPTKRTRRLQGGPWRAPSLKNFIDNGGTKPIVAGTTGGTNATEETPPPLETVAPSARAANLQEVSAAVGGTNH